MAGYGKILEYELSISPHEVGEEAGSLGNAWRPKMGRPRNAIIVVVQKTRVFPKIVFL